MRKLLTTALLSIAFTLPVSYAFAAPQHGGGHQPHMPSMNHDAHGDAVSTAAHAKTADAEDKNHGKAVSETANDKSKGHEKSHGHHHKHH